MTLDKLIEAFDRAEHARNRLLEENKDIIDVFKKILMVGNDNYWDYSTKKTGKTNYPVIQELRSELNS